MMYNCTYIPYCLKYGPGIYFFPVIVNQATKWDRRLLVKDSCAVYNLWCQWWIVMEADDAWSATLCVLLCMLQHTIPRPLNETRCLYETGRNSRQYDVYTGVSVVYEPWMEWHIFLQEWYLRSCIQNVMLLSKMVENIYPLVCIT